jgi:hypothetical protein
MGLRTTNITTTLVGNALGSSSHVLSTLCTDASINKWSKYKPVQGNYPAGDGFYGLDMSDWDYIKPTNTFRLGDFRSYNHYASPPFELTTYPASTVYNVSGFTFSITVNESDLTPEDLTLGDWYFGVKITDQYDNHYWYSAVNPLDERSTEIGARTITLGGLEGSYTWETFISSFAVTGGEEPLQHKALPAFGSYVINGYSTIILEAPSINTINNVPDCNCTFVISGGQVYLYALNTWTGVGYFYDDSNNTLLDNYVFSGSDITTGQLTTIAAPSGYGSHLTVRVESS